MSTLLVSTSASQDNYNPGETCHIFGYVKTQYGAMVEGAPVSIQVINPQGAAIHIASTKTDGSGYYSNLFTLSSNAQTGTYTIYVTASKAGYNKGFRTNVFTVGESHTPGVSIESLYTTTPDESEQEEFYPGQPVVLRVAVPNAGADLRKARIWIEVADPNGIPLTVLVSVQDLGRGRDAKIGIQFPLGAQAPRGTYKVSSYVSTGLISEGGKFLAYEQTIFIVS
ncbi:MAG: MG2 domain-containing protein [Candidatus Bathyarchaeia archaeon]